jgi:hypothetical protein
LQTPFPVLDEVLDKWSAIGIVQPVISNDSTLNGPISEYTSEQRAAGIFGAAPADSFRNRMLERPPGKIIRFSSHLCEPFQSLGWRMVRALSWLH